MTDRIKNLESQLQKARKVIEFYGDYKGSWCMQEDTSIPLFEDKGQRARDYLTEKGES